MKRQDRKGQKLIRRSATTWRIYRETEHRFAKGHPRYPSTEKLTDDEKAVMRIKRQIMNQYGWRRIRDLTLDQRTYIDVQARARHRMQKYGDELSVADFSTLVNIDRKAGRALYYGGASP